MTTPRTRTPPRELISPARHYDIQRKDDCRSFISKLSSSISNGIHFTEPPSSYRTDEINLVRAITQMIQGFSSSIFIWDEKEKLFRLKNQVFVSHLSQSSLKSLLDQFLCCGTNLKLVELFIKRVESLKSRFPTLDAFGNSISSWLKKLRSRASKEEVISSSVDLGKTATLLGLTNSLSSVCSGGQHLLKIANEAIPGDFLSTESSIPASEISVLILDYLYNRLNEVSSVHGGEEEAYHMLLFIFIGTLLPYLKGLNSWIFDGVLDDPYEEMFFYPNSSVTIEQPAFWDQSYLLRPRIPNSDSTFIENDQINIDDIACPLFLRTIAKGIIAAGKSLKLIRFLEDESHSKFGKGKYYRNQEPENFSTVKYDHGFLGIGYLTLSESFLISLVGLICNGTRVSDDIIKVCDSFSGASSTEVLQKFCTNMQANLDSDSLWWTFFTHTVKRKKEPIFQSFNLENPVITVCPELSDETLKFMERLNISRSFDLPPLDDEILRNDLFGSNSDLIGNYEGGTDYMFGFKYNKSEHLHSLADVKSLGSLYPFPTILPRVTDNMSTAEIMPFQEDSSIAARISLWFQNAVLKDSPLPVVIIESCLQEFIKKQVDHVGKQILVKLMNDWRLMDELRVLRAIYLCGSGDILQEFLISIFGKIERGEPCDDDFELNTILQDSIRNSADSSILCSPDSLSVSNSVKDEASNENKYALNVTSAPWKASLRIGDNNLDFLKFTYKVHWPLDLIINAEAIEKYSQVMQFLLRVKHAKFVLDKARMWMWKRKSCLTCIQKRHLLLEQKLLHFVDAFHQYIMDRVFHSSWIELCQNMASTGSLDEVISVHEAYLDSVQRQCFVARDKLWTLISSRIKVILGLAFDFYSIQRTLQTGGASQAIKTRCEMEIDRIEKQFDDCISFLLRILSLKLNVGQFPHLVDLVTRINYNHFYMSSCGNFTTQPSFELVSKLGRAHQSRAE